MRLWVLLLVVLSSCAIFRPTTPPESAQTKSVVKKRSSPAKSSIVKPNAELLQKLSRPGVVLLDVRTPEEFSNGRVRGAKNINFLADNFEEQVDKLDRKKTYYLYCASGNRSGKALHYFTARKIKAESIEPYETLKNAGVQVEGLDP